MHLKKMGTENCLTVFSVILTEDTLLGFGIAHLIVLMILCISDRICGIAEIVIKFISVCSQLGTYFLGGHIVIGSPYLKELVGIQPYKVNCRSVNLLIYIDAFRIVHLPHIRGEQLVLFKPDGSCIILIVRQVGKFFIIEYIVLKPSYDSVMLLFFLGKLHVIIFLYAACQHYRCTYKKCKNLFQLHLSIPFSRFFRSAVFVISIISDCIFIQL